MTTTRTFAGWVAPAAERARANRAQVVAFARSVPAGFWDRPSPLEGWTCKDLLAHIGKANDQMFQEILRRVLAGEQIDRGLFAPDTDGENRRRIEERRAWPASRVIDEVEEAGEEIQDMLSHLGEEHGDYKQDDPPFVLSGFLKLVGKEDHDLEHLAQLRAALEADA